MSDESDYTYKKHDDGSCYGCDSCGYLVPLKVFDHQLFGELSKYHLCWLCANTFAGVSLFYSKEDRQTLSTICFIGNAILEKLDKMIPSSSVGRA